MADGVQETFIPAASSHIASFTYDPREETLDVEFKDGQTYSYQNVDPDVVRRWQRDGGSGKFFYRNIRLNYPYEQT